MPLMKCGCVSQAVRPNGDPVCTSHMNLTPDAEIVAATVPDFGNRQAKCPYCGEFADSKNYERLPFFEHRPDKSYDSYYCGCRGWN